MRKLRQLASVCLVVAAGHACTADERIERPSPLYGESPFQFPIELWDKGVEGETLVAIHITALGEVDSAYVYKSSGYYAFDSAAVEGARKLRFVPGRRGEKRINMWAKLPVRFTREGATAGEATRIPD